MNNVRSTVSIFIKNDFFCEISVFHARTKSGYIILPKISVGIKNM